MKSKTIKAVLKKKINDFLDSIEDVSLRREMSKNIIVTGGSIVSMLLNETPNDFDIYFRNREVAKKVAQYYADYFNKLHEGESTKIGTKKHAWILDGEDVELWKKNEKKLTDFAYGYEYETDTPSGMITSTTPDRIKVMINSDGVAEEDALQDLSVEAYIEQVSKGDEIEDIHLEELAEDKPKYRPIFLTTNAVTLSNKIQLIIRFYGEPESIHENYDFVHCTCYWTSWNEELVLPSKALEAILNKELRYVGSKYPICSVIRTKKFIKRGWQINAGQYLKMAFQVSQLDLTDLSVLEDQLVGVDSVYFMQAIEALREKQDKDNGFKFDSSYLNTVIDRIF